MSQNDSPNQSFEENDVQQKEWVNMIVRELQQHPPTIGLVGMSGVGKSFTINTLFKTSLPTSAATACTKEFRSSELSVDVKQGQLAGSAVPLRVIDAPGLGEDIALDPSYLEMYRQHLPQCDVILWVLAARNRAVALDEMYLEKLSDFADKMIFGLNQIDLIEPLNWNHNLNAPSRAQMKNLDIIQQDRKEKIESVLGRPVKMIPYSAKHSFDLQPLFDGAITSCSQERAQVFNIIKNFSHLDFLPQDVRSRVLAQLFKRRTSNT